MTTSTTAGRHSVLRSRSFQKTWLLVTAIVVGGFGPIFSLATSAAFDAPARLSLDILAWPLDGTQRYEGATMRFLTALTGGFLFGWGVMIYGMHRWLYEVAPEATRRTVLIGLLAWFVLDSIGSIVAGVPSNAGFNVLVLLLCAGPLWWSPQHD